MKRKLFVFLLLAVFAVVALALTACAKTVTISFDAGDGSGTVPKSIVVKAGDTVTLPQADGLTKYGRVFAGWELDDEVYQAGYTFKALKDVTFTAKWQKNAVITSFVNGPFNGIMGTVTEHNSTSVLFTTGQGGQGQCQVRITCEEGSFGGDFTYAVSSGTVTVNSGEEVVGTGTIVRNTINVTFTLDARQFDLVGEMYLVTVVIGGESNNVYVAKGTPLKLLVDSMNMSNDVDVLVDGEAVDINDVNGVVMGDRHIVVEIVEQQQYERYTGVFEGSAVTITLLGNGKAQLDYGAGKLLTLDCVLVGNVLTVTVTFGGDTIDIDLYLDANEHTFIQFDALRNVAYTSTQGVVLQFDGKGGVILGEHSGSYVIYTDSNAEYQVVMTFDSVEIGINFVELRLGGDLVAAFTLGDTEYVFNILSNDVDEPIDIDIEDIVGIWSNDQGATALITTAYAHGSTLGLLFFNESEVFALNKGLGALVSDGVTVTYDGDRLTIVRGEQTVIFTYQNTTPEDAAAAMFDGTWIHRDTGWTLSDFEISIFDGQISHNGANVTHIEFCIVAKYLLIHCIVDSNGVEAHYYYALYRDSDTLVGACNDQRVNFELKEIEEELEATAQSLEGKWTNGNDVVIISTVGNGYQDGIMEWAGSVIIGGEFIGLTQGVGFLSGINSLGWEITVTVGSERNLLVTVEDIGVFSTTISYATRESLENSSLHQFVGVWQDSYSATTLQIDAASVTVSGVTGSVQYFVVGKYLVVLFESDGFPCQYLLSASDDNQQLIGYVTWLGSTPEQITLARVFF